MQVARVNQDIVDSVIDLLQEEPSTLACCALVCRDWRRKVRKVLFAHITLPYVQPFLSIAAGIQRRLLFDELVNGDPDIALLVKSLTLSPTVPRISGHGCTWARGYAYNNLCHLSNLRSLTISLLHSESLAEIAEEAVSVFPSLESLSFDQITLPLPPRVERRDILSFDSINRSYRRLRLRRLALCNPLASRAAMRHESTALVARLHELGEISALTSLELLAAPELTQDWIPHFPLIGRTLRHCAIAVNDVVTSGIFYCSGTAELRKKVTDTYRALLACSALRSLRIKYDGYPTFAEEVINNRLSPNPLISPFFLEALSSVLSQPDPPFPHLESLAFDLSCNIESLALCGPAWMTLLRALTNKGCYPKFSTLSVDMEEFTTYSGTLLRFKYDPDVRAAKVREMFQKFEDAGIKVEISVRKSSASIIA